MKFKEIILGSLIFLAIACTDNFRAKKLGGKEEIVLKSNEILLNVTWKGTHMWILTQDTLTDLCYFREKSSWGVWEGEIILRTPVDIYNSSKEKKMTEGMEYDSVKRRYLYPEGSNKTPRRAGDFIIESETTPNQ